MEPSERSEDIFAREFAAPIDSPVHIRLRDNAWLGGALVVGRYLLGRLTNTNPFRLKDDEFHNSLAAFLLPKYPLIGPVFKTGDGVDLAVALLRYAAQDIPDIGPAPTLSQRRSSAAAHFLALKPDIDDAALAESVGCSLKQLARLSDVAWFRRIIRDSESRTD